MIYDIYCKLSTGEEMKASEFEIEDGRIEHANLTPSLYLAKYMSRWYPLGFFDDTLDETSGDSEKVLKDNRTGKIVWREGEHTIKIEEGAFWITETKGEPKAPMSESDQALLMEIRTLMKTEKPLLKLLDFINKQKIGAYTEGLYQGRGQGYTEATGS